MIACYAFPSSCVQPNDGIIMGGKANTPPGPVDFAWKILITGHGGVGKTTLIHRYIHNEFKEDTLMTIGCAHHSQYIERNDSCVNLVLWDLGGQDRFDIIHPAYAGGAAGAYVMFDMSDMRTLDGVDKWVSLVRKCNPPATPVFLVGSKFDLVADQGQLDTIYAIAAKKQLDLGMNAFMVTSSKLDFGVREAIEYLIDYMFWQQACIDAGAGANA